MQQQKKPRKPQYVSPAGVAVFPWLNRPDTKFDKEGKGGVYKTGLRLSAEEFTTALVGGKPFQQFIDELVLASVAEAQQEHPKERKQIKARAPYQVETDDAGEETGTVLVSFKQNARIVRKDQTVVNITIPLFNAQGQPIDEPIYGGSIIKVAFTVRNTWMQASKEAGVRFDIAAVQAIKVQKTDRSASDFGFSLEDDGMEPAAGGYDATAAGPGEDDQVDF
jgi:hypothetical protein